MAAPFQRALTDEERVGIVLAVQSTFATLRDLYQQIDPIFERLGFASPSPGVVARELSEKVEAAIVQHCASFANGPERAHLERGGRTWKVRLSKDSGLTIGQSEIVNGDNFIVVNYKANGQVVRVWVLWDASEHFFSPKRAHSSTRALLTAVAAPRIELVFGQQLNHQGTAKRGPMAKAALPSTRRRKTVG